MRRRRIAQGSFDKIKKMLEGMVAEICTNAHTRQLKGDKVDELKSRIEEQSAKSALLSQGMIRLSEK